MIESSIRRGVVATGLAVAVAVSGCAAGQTPRPAASSPAASDPASTPAASASPSVNTSGSASGALLVVLADGPDGVRGLWTLGAHANWAHVTDTPGATALGAAPGGVALATETGIEVRLSASLATTSSITPLKWAAPLPVLDVDISDSGKIALAAVDAGAGITRYATAGADGVVAVLTGAPAQSFSPLVAWVGESKLLVLSTDKQQVSRLALLDPASQKLDPAQALSGVRVFAVSGDGRTIAAATATSIYVLPVAGLDGPAAPAPVTALAEAGVVWAMALDETGSRLWTLSGEVGSDGSVGSVRELGYSRVGGAWQKVIDVAVPFKRGVDQVYVA
jgi:hypothetical protein